MGDIMRSPQEDHRLFRVQAGKIAPQRLLERQAIRQAAQPVLRVGRIEGDHIKRRILQRHAAAFMPVLLIPDPERNRKRRFLAKIIVPE